MFEGYDAGLTIAEASRIATLNGATYMGRGNATVKGEPRKSISAIENTGIVPEDGVDYESTEAAGCGEGSLWAGLKRFLW